MNVGDIVDGRYRLLDLLGEGAAGKVFRCEDLGRNNMFVALKLLRAKDTRWENFFRREFEVLSRLHHPNLVSVYDFGPAPEENTWYFTQELVVGRPLLDAAAGKKVDEVIALFIEICRALEFIHGHSVLHRDLKPANILVQQHAEPGERVRVLDFGLWRELDNTPQRGARWAGTPPYLASEVLRGFGHSISADLYAVGVTLFQVLTRKLPHGRGTPQELLVARKEKAPDLTGMVKPELVRLITRLLDEEPTGRPQSAAEVASALSQLIPNHAVAMPLALGRARLVGRDGERAKLSEIVDGLKERKDSSPRLVTLTGAAGLGKTRFVHELKAEVQLKGGRSAVGACIEDARWAFRPVADLVRALAPLAGRVHLTDAEKKVIERLLPEVGGARAHHTGELSTAEREQFNAAAVDLILGLSGPTACVLIVEDISFCDPASLTFFQALLRRSRGTGVLVVVTALEHEAIPRELVDAVGGDVVRLKLEPLTPEDVKALACALLAVPSVPDAFAQMLASHARGSPLVVEHLLSLMIDRGELRRTDTGWNFEELNRVAMGAVSVGALMDRVERLARHEEDVLSALAVLDRPSGPKLLAAVARVDIAQVRQALASAERSGLVRVLDEKDGRPRVIFCHPQVRDALLARLDARRERAAWHRVCAEVLEEKSQDKLDAVAEAVAVHAEAGGDIAKAARMYLIAAEHALATAGFDRAVRWGRKANRILHKTTSSPAELARADLVVGHGLIATGHTAEARAFLEGAVTRAGVEESPDAFAQLHALLGAAMNAMGLLDGGLTYIERALQIVSPVRAPSAAARLLIARATLQRHADAEKAFDDSQKAAELLGAAPSVDDAIALEDIVTSAALATGQNERALAAARSRLERARVRGHVVDEIPALRALAGALAATGNRLEARQNLNAALALAIRNGHRVEEALVTKALGDQLFVSGEYKEAATRYQRAATLAAELGQTAERAETLESIGCSYYAKGDYDRAVEHLRAAADAFEKQGVVARLVVARANLVLAYLAKGLLPEAEELIKATSKLLPSSGLDEARASVLYAQGQLFTARGDLKKARKAFLYAVVIRRRDRNLYALGEALAGYGQLLLRAREPKRAWRIARRAETVFTHLDARGQLKRITPLLNAASGLSDTKREIPGIPLR